MVPLTSINGPQGATGMLAFLKGPKECTGERFAMADVRRVLAALVTMF